MSEITPKESESKELAEARADILYKEGIIDRADEIIAQLTRDLAQEKVRSRAYHKLYIEYFNKFIKKF